MNEFWNMDVLRNEQVYEIISLERDSTDDPNSGDDFLLFI